MMDNEALTAAGQRALAAWAGLVQRSAALIVVLLLVLTALAGAYTAQNLAINTSTSDMISPETPFRRNAIEFGRAFPQFKDLIVVVVDAPTPEKAETVARQLVSAARANQAVFERVEWPEGDPYFRRNGLLYRSAEELSALGDRLAEAAPFLSTLAQRPNLEGLFDVLTQALETESADPAIARILAKIGDPLPVAGDSLSDGLPALSWRALFDLGDTRRQIVLIKAVVDDASLAPSAASLDAIRDIAADIDGVGIGAEQTPSFAGTTVRMTGSVALDEEELESAAVGGKVAGLISLALVTILLIAGLRSVWLILPALVTLMAGLICTAAFAAFAIGHLNLISVAFAVLFVGLGIDFSIHFCLRYREALGDSSTPAVGRAATEVGGALAIGGLCAALGFLSFLPTEYRGLAELGIISAGGMAIALFLNLTLLPALLTLLPNPKPQILNPSAVRFQPGRTVVLIALACGIVGAVTALYARFDFNPMNLKDPESESVRTFYSLADDGRNGVYAIDLLAKDRAAAKAEARRLLALPAVGAAVTIDSLIPDDQESKLAILEDLSFFLVPALETPDGQSTLTPAQRKAAVSAFRDVLLSVAARNEGDPFAQTARRAAATLNHAEGNPQLASALEHRLLRHLPGTIAALKMALSAEHITFEGLPNPIRDAWLTADGGARVQLRPAEPVKDNDGLRSFATAVLTAAPTATGTPVTITEAGGAVVTAFQQATLYAFVAVCLVLLIVLRSIRDTALVMFPLILAAVYTGATSVVLDLPFNFANVIVLPLLFGLGVASGIHLVVRARRANDTAALMRTSTPRAVLFSALTTIASFGSLALSGHRGMTSMGQLLTIAIVYTLLCALFVLPATLRWIEHRTDR